MKLPEFIEKKTSEGFEYHLPVPYEGFIFPKLLDSLDFKPGTEIAHDLFSFVNQNTISSFTGFDENATLYAIALNVLVKNKKALLAYLGSPEEIKKIQENALPVKIEWWNSIQFMRGETLCKNFGFQSPATFLEKVNYADKDLSNRYFYVNAIEEENLHKYAKLYGGDVTNWFFVFYDPEKETSVISALTDRSNIPDLTSFLGTCSSMVNIQVGGDEGYLDYLLIQSASDLKELISEIKEKQLVFIRNYQNLLNEYLPFDEEYKLGLYKQSYLELIKSLK